MHGWAIVATINDRIVNLPDKVVQEEGTEL